MTESPLPDGDPAPQTAALVYPGTEVQETLDGLADILTAPERAVLRLIIAGSSTTTIAAALLLLPGTVTNHTHAIMAKLGAHSRVETVGISLSRNILGTP